MARTVVSILLALCVCMNKPLFVVGEALRGAHDTPVRVADSVPITFVNYKSEAVQVYLSYGTSFSFQPILYLPAATDSTCYSVTWNSPASFTNGAFKVLPACSAGTTPSNLLEVNLNSCDFWDWLQRVVCLDYYDISCVSQNPYCGSNGYDQAVCGGQYTTGMSLIPNTAGCTQLTCTSSSCSDAYQFPYDDSKVRACSSSIPGYTLQILNDNSAAHATQSCIDTTDWSAGC